MNIGIIVYSHTNNTLTIAKRLESYLFYKGHSAIVHSIKTDNENPNASSFHLINQSMLNHKNAKLNKLGSIHMKFRNVNNQIDRLIEKCNNWILA